MTTIGPIVYAYFEQHLKAEKGLSPASVSSYRDTLRLFLYWRNDRAPGDYVYEVRLSTFTGQPAEAVVQTLSITDDSPAGANSASTRSIP